jgi:hypothetical protein
MSLLGQSSCLSTSHIDAFAAHLCLFSRKHNKELRLAPQLSHLFKLHFCHRVTAEA